jgi:hypothetical protein
MPDDNEFVKRIHKVLCDLNPTPLDDTEQVRKQTRAVCSEVRDILNELAVKINEGRIAVENPAMFIMNLAIMFNRF